MTNLEKYEEAFLKNFRVTREQLPELQYRRIEDWDSLGHMDLMSDLEEAFGIRIAGLDVLAFSSYEKGKTILAKYGVEF